MIPLRVILKPAELGTTHGLAQLYLGWGGVGASLGLLSWVRATSVCSGALGLYILIYKVG